MLMWWGLPLSCLSHELPRDVWPTALGNWILDNTDYCSVPATKVEQSELHSSPCNPCQTLSLLVRKPKVTFRRTRKAPINTSSSGQRGKSTAGPQMTAVLYRSAPAPSQLRGPATRFPTTAFRCCATHFQVHLEPGGTSFSDTRAFKNKRETSFPPKARKQVVRVR